MPVSDTDPRSPLAATISPLVAAGDCADIRAALEWASRAGYRGVQLSATDPALRPRDLSQSARRDLAATLARLELSCAGIDLFLPSAHLSDPVHVSRAFEAIVAAIELGSVLGRAPVTIPLGPREELEVRAAISAVAQRQGVPVLLPVVQADECAAVAAPFAASIDCAAALAAGSRPEDLVLRAHARLGGIRLVDLQRSGLRGPILEPRESRLDALELRASLDAVAFDRMLVVDARQWNDPRASLERVLERWNALSLR